MLVPSTRSRHNDTPFFEFQLIDRATGDQAFVQVKSGNIKLDPNEYTAFPYKMFLFSPAGYQNLCPSGKEIELLEKEDIETFLWCRKNFLPTNVRYWLDFLEQHQ